MRGELTSFFGHLDYRIKLHQKTLATVEPFLATKFNVFDFISPDENRLSDVLACLLAPSGIHAQGGVFLDEFLNYVCDLKFQVADYRRVEVRREERTGLIDRTLRRLDILIEFEGQSPGETFGVAIENKPWASEQTDQVGDYLNELRARYGDDFKLIYLSASGDEPESVSKVTREAAFKSGHLVCSSYSFPETSAKRRNRWRAVMV